VAVLVSFVAVLVCGRFGLWPFWMSPELIGVARQLMEYNRPPIFCQHGNLGFDQVGHSTQQKLLYYVCCLAW